MLFSETAKEIIFSQPKDLKEVIEHPKGFRFEGDDESRIHEEFCLYIFLVGCFKICKLSLPIKVISNESPDFILIETNKNKEIGIEHTRATLESYKIAESEPKKHPKKSVIELCHYSPSPSFLQILSTHLAVHYPAFLILSSAVILLLPISDVSGCQTNNLLCQHFLFAFDLTVVALSAPYLSQDPTCPSFKRHLRTY